MSNYDPDLDEWDRSYTDGALISWEDGIDSPLPWRASTMPSCWGDPEKRGREACEDCPCELTCYLEAYGLAAEEPND